MKLFTQLIFNAPPKKAKEEKPKAVKPWFSIRNEESQPHAEILIYDQIGENWWDEGVGAKSFSQQLKAIPTDREIIVGINSPGGSVWDGLAIYNLLFARRNKVVTRIDGIALSIASVIALAGREVRMPRSALFMIHNPWTVAQGDAEEMRRVAEALDKHRDAIVATYETKTGKEREELVEKMDEETWFTGDEAKEFGFADVVTEDEPALNSFDLSGFRNMPAALNRTAKPPTNSAVPKAGGQPQIMNKEKIIALLKKHGVTPKDDATIEELEALLDQVLAAKNTPAAPPAPAPAPAPAAAPAPAPANDDGNAKRIAALEAKYDAERKVRIERDIDAAINDRKILAAQREAWLKRAMADETILTDIAAMQALPAPADGGVRLLSDAPQDLAKGILVLRGPVDAITRGNAADVKAIQRNAVQIAEIVAKHGDRLRSVLNANTVDANLKRTVILNEVMRAFKRRIIALNAFSTVFRNVPLEGTDKVTVPYYPLFTTASVDFDQNNGYVFAANSNTSSKEVEVSERKYQPFQFNSSELSRQPYLDVTRLAMMQAEQLGVDVFNDVLSDVTAANFGAAVKSVPAEAFDVVDVIDLDVLAEQLDWPEVGRALILDSAYRGNLAKALLDASAAGSDQALRKGATGTLSNFEVFSNPRIPANGEFLKGMMVLPSAKLVATAPIIPAPGVRKQLVSYDIVTDPETGLSFEYRYWGDPNMDEDREVIECNYGYDLGEVAALKRITSQ